MIEEGKLEGTEKVRASHTIQWKRHPGQNDVRH